MSKRRPAALLVKTMNIIQYFLCVFQASEGDGGEDHRRRSGQARGGAGGQARRRGAGEAQGRDRGGGPSSRRGGQAHHGETDARRDGETARSRARRTTAKRGTNYFLFHAQAAMASLPTPR